MIWSAGVSTTHSSSGSRSSSLQTSQICASVKVLHFSQCCRCSVANSSERPSFSAPGSRIVLHQVIGHALRRLRPDARQRAQRFDERRQGGRLFHALGTLCSEG
jgi:hypothetical protein